MRLFILIVSCLIPLALGDEVAFTMTRGRKQDTYIKFEYTPTKVNAEISQDVGAFRCNDAGLYFFTFTALPPRSEILKVSLRKNKIPVTTIYASEIAHSSVSGSMTLWLRPNDLVYPFIEDGEILESTAKTRALTSFSGFKISSTPSRDGQMGMANEHMSGDFSRSSDDAETLGGVADPSDRIQELFKSDRHP